MAPERPKAVIVDLDDTILHSGDPKAAWWQVCTEFAGGLGLMPGGLFDALSAAVDWFWDNDVRAREGRLDLHRSPADDLHAGTSLPRDMKDPEPVVVDAMAHRYTALRDEAVKPFQGALTALERLRESGIRLALLTNGSAEKQWGKIRQFGLARYFDHIQVEGDVGFGKPDAQAFEHALSALDARPHETWMVGDNLLADIAGAQRSGHSCDLDRRAPATVSTRAMASYPTGLLSRSMSCSSRVPPAFGTTS